MNILCQLIVNSQQEDATTQQRDLIQEGTTNEDNRGQLTTQTNYSDGDEGPVHTGGSNEVDEVKPFTLEDSPRTRRSADLSSSIEQEGGSAGDLILDDA